MKLYEKFYRMFGIYAHGENQKYLSNVPMREVFSWFKSIEDHLSVVLIQTALVSFVLGMLTALISAYLIVGAK